jgi:hypothetical protein
VDRGRVVLDPRELEQDQSACVAVLRHLRRSPMRCLSGFSEDAGRDAVAGCRWLLGENLIPTALCRSYLAAGKRSLQEAY